jgi:hypothetical protein
MNVSEEEPVPWTDAISSSPAKMPAIVDLLEQVDQALDVGVVQGNARSALCVP